MRLTNVVAFCLGDIPSAKVGIVEIMNYLQHEQFINFQFYLTAQLTKEILAEADIIISIRSADSYELDIIKECKRLGKLVIYYLDDDLLNIPLDATSKDYFNTEMVRKNIITIINNSDFLLTNNIHIKRKYESFVNKRAVIIDAPALLIKEVAIEKHSENERECIKIGFSGGIDHKTNIEKFLKRPLNDLKAKYKDGISFEFMGAEPDLGALNYKFIPYKTNYEEYIQEMKNIHWDIGIAILPASDFHASKYFNKYLEYGAIGAAGIYSDVEPYRFVVKNEINGLLVENTEDGWFHGLSYLIDNTVLRRTIAINSRLHLEEKFSVSKIASDCIGELNDLVTFRAQHCNPNEIKLNLGSNKLLFSKVFNIFKSMGYKAPVYIIKKIIEKMWKNNK
ncbi:hypothetical protein DC345_26520 [Paenibacillus taichungensis]|uniref:Glycosyltransferase involved in cell wall biosynthesis n=1 Tax=Paenibacillus taichungensis TaxID=484184 RepID=A0A329QHW4_9BACL|nr:glycosyltransferase family 1 protein [Paenibacillus taichungensis]RAW10902.1 hypothetical protein DC345_26520 [Paenibacillus taichungensis]